MKVKNIILVFLVACVFSSCIANNIAWGTNTNIKRVQIGMGKEEVIGILGDKYMITSSSKDSQGNNLEVIGYKSDAYEEYKLSFVNNKLIEWNREHVDRYVTKETAVQ